MAAEQRGVCVRRADPRVLLSDGRAFWEGKQLWAEVTWHWGAVRSAVWDRPLGRCGAMRSSNGGTPGSSAVLSFLNSVLSARGPNALPYMEEHKWSIREQVMQLHTVRGLP